MIGGTLLSGIGSLLSGGDVVYNEEGMQDYANDQYAQLFGGNNATYEDNVLIVMLTNEDLQTWYCIGWVGDNLATDVNNLFGNEKTALGKAMSASINSSNYKYSLGTNLAQVVESLQSSIENLKTNSVYRVEKAESHPAGQVYNKSADGISFSEETVNAALKEFTEATDITMSIVVADSTEVFGRTLGADAIIALIVGVILIVVAVVKIYQYVKYRREEEAHGR